MERGYLSFKLSSAHKTLPIQGAQITVTNEQGNILYNLISDESGNTQGVFVCAPDSAQSLEPSDIPPYAMVHASILKPGYRSVQVNGIRIFGTETTNVPINMVPLVIFNQRAESTDCYHIGRNNLLNSPVPSPDPPLEQTYSQLTSDVMIPDYITVHLGSPNLLARNIRVSFIDYIKNVASSEIYPTWPRAAIEANILCYISNTLSRLYMQWYSSQGKGFDITNATAFDHSYVEGGAIHESISRIVDELFNNYIRCSNSKEPFFIQHYNGSTVAASGLSQWGSVSLAQLGLNAFEILKRYFPQDIEISQSHLLQDIEDSYPGTVLCQNNRSADVQHMQIYLNQIRANYPLIPKIVNPNGFMGPDTADAVRTFQRIFNLSPDGIIGSATWYKISYLFAAVNRIETLDTAISIAIDATPPDIILREGSSGKGVNQLQLLLNFISEFVPEVPFIHNDGVFGSKTKAGVMAFQQFTGLTADGIAGTDTWNALYSMYHVLNKGDAIPHLLPPSSGPSYPGTLLKIGSRGDDIRLIQRYLNRTSNSYNAIQRLAEDGIFGNGTRSSIIIFQRQFALTPDGIVGPTTWHKIVEIYSNLTNGAHSNENYPGMPLQMDSHGERVSLIQNYLNAIANQYGLFSPIVVDGILGNSTENAVINYQRRYGFTSDGVVGPTTWQSIISEYNKIINNRNMIQSMSNTLLRRMFFM